MALVAGSRRSLVCRHQFLDRGFLDDSHDSQASTGHPQKRRRTSTMGSNMNEEQTKALLMSLKACERNYHSHIREFGKLTVEDINLWKHQLQDMKPQQILNAFNVHIQESSFFPTVHDIVGKGSERKTCDDWNHLLNQQQVTFDPMYEMIDGEKKPLRMTDEQRQRLHQLITEAKSHGSGGNKTGTAMARQRKRLLEASEQPSD